MANNFKDVSSGYDLELIIDQNVVGHLLQLIKEGEESLGGDLIPLVLNNFKVNRGETYKTQNENNEGSDVAFSFIDVEGQNEYIFIAIQIFIDSHLNNSLVLRVRRNFNFISLVNSVKNSENIYSSFETFIRIEGIVGNNHPDSYSTQEEFQNDILRNTKEFYSFIKRAGFNFNIPEILENAIFSSFAAYQEFLKILHDFLKISEFVGETLNKINASSPFVLKDILLNPYPSSESSNKLGLYANFNTAHIPSRGNINDAVVFASGRQSGLGLNINRDLLEAMLLSTIRFEMQKLLEDNKISQTRFDSVEYSFPFKIPSEVFSSLGVDEIPNSLIARDKNLKLEVNKFKASQVKKKFKGQTEKIDALKLTITLSNNDNNFGEALLDGFTPNVNIIIYIGLNNPEKNIEFLVEGKINMKFNFLTGFLAFLIAPFFKIFMFFGVFIIGNVLIDKKIEPFLKNSLNSNTYALAFSILKKRWDPFYTTLHQIRFKIESVGINNKEQIKIIFSPELFKSFVPYDKLYLKELNFDSADSISSFKYSLEDVDIIKEDTVATDRIEDLYTLDNLTRELDNQFTEEIKQSLKVRESESKILTNINYSPQFVDIVSQDIMTLRVLSDFRKDKIRNSIISIYLEQKTESYIDLFLQLLLKLVPDYDINSITNAQFSELKRELRKLIQDTTDYKNYRSTEWLKDLPQFLRENEDELLKLTPKQLALSGMNSTSAGNVLVNLGKPPKEYFNFIDMKDYQALAFNDKIFIRNAPNNKRGDNIALLPSFDETE